MNEMKKSLVIMTMIVSSLIITGCNVKSSDDVKKETDEIIRNSQKQMDELTDFLYVGGQPGKILVKGIIVKKDEEKFLLDERIKLEQIGGKGNRGVSQVLVSDKNRAELTEATEASDVKTLSYAQSLKTYINLGCEKLSPDEIEGLELVEPKPMTESVLSLSAKKIFICGASQFAQDFVSLAADQLILNYATLVLKTSMGSLSVSTSKIVLKGSSSLETVGMDSTISVKTAPSLQLIVASEIEGDGTLRVTSVGGSCVQKDEIKP